MSANITRLRVIYRDCKSDAKILEELRDELKRRRTKSARELLIAVQRQIDSLITTQRDDMVGGNPIADDVPVSSGGSNETAGSTPRVLSPREIAAQKRIAELRMRLLDLSNGNRLLNYKLATVRVVRFA